MTNNSMANKSMTSTNNIRVGGSSLVGHLGNVTSQIIGIVVDMLDPSIREVDRVRARNSSSSIIRLSLGKVRTRVVIRHSILVGVGRGLSQIIHITTNSMSHWMCTNQGSSMSNKSMANNTTGEELRGSRCHSQESRTDKGLHCELCV